MVRLGDRPARAPVPPGTEDSRSPPPIPSVVGVIFVFEVHLRPGGTAEQYAEAWVRASEIIQTAPGARGTRLHRKLGDPEVLLAIASWESKPRRDRAEAQRDPRVQAILDQQSRFVEIRVVGEFDDPEWVVLPPGGQD
jgi:heme-degrading monooxygenase HmoA